MKTKQFIIAALILVFVQGGLMAQNDFSFTPKVGFNMSNISGTGFNDGGSNPRYGVNVGFSVEKMILPRLALESGIFYSMQGMRFESGSLDVNMDYINVPVLAKYYLFRGLNVYAGPQLGINVKAETKGSLVGDETVDIKDDIKTLDPALVVGLGYQFDMGLSVSANYNWSFLNQAKSNGHHVSSEHGDYHNNVLQVNLGWRF